MHVSPSFPIKTNILQALILTEQVDVLLAMFWGNIFFQHLCNLESISRKSLLIETPGKTRLPLNLARTSSNCINMQFGPNRDCTSQLLNLCDSNNKYKPWLDAFFPPNTCVSDSTRRQSATTTPSVIWGFSWIFRLIYFIVLWFNEEKRGIGDLCDLSLALTLLLYLCVFTLFRTQSSIKTRQTGQIPRNRVINSFFDRKRV